MFSCDLDFKSPELHLIDHFLNEHPDVDAIFCSSDVIAMYVMSVLQRRNYRVPEDVQIIGFDNIELSEILIPPLTTIAQPINDIAVQAINTLIELIDKKEVEDLHKVLPVSLVERQSTL